MSKTYTIGISMPLFHSRNLYWQHPDDTWIMDAFPIIIVHVQTMMVETGVQDPTLWLPPVIKATAQIQKWSTSTTLLPKDGSGHMHFNRYQLNKFLDMTRCWATGRKVSNNKTWANGKVRPKTVHRDTITVIHMHRTLQCFTLPRLIRMICILVGALYHVAERWGETWRLFFLITWLYAYMARSQYELRKGFVEFICTTK